MADDDKQAKIDFNSEPQKKQKKSLFNFGRKRVKEEVKTVIKVKTVGDVPTIVSARKNITEGNVKDAIILAYSEVKNDYIRYFGIQALGQNGERSFIVETLKGLGIDLPEEAIVDGKFIVDRISSIDLTSTDPKLACFVKLTEFYLLYYERAKYSDSAIEDSGDIIDRLTGIYNYMDITKLYFRGEDTNVNT
ncbi:hypothetical protein [Thermoplasma sp. Kam2015]|uniref:hypothetical protein n=1 Tax=Thermoplasma sp. Kam2015 TaxID=2094122 RepID=UPI001F447F76|nr:hypothetical protein [Thermoplasma sp. Kam2015]